MKEERVGQLFLAGIGLLGLLIVGGLVWAIMAGPSSTSSTNGTAEQNLSFKDDNDPAQGPGESKVVVRMFEDFQCPSCGAAAPGVAYAIKTYGDKVRFIWDDFPLTMHKNAVPAANAARCAEEQGKFWEYHDKLYAEQANWADVASPTSLFVGYAKTLNLNEQMFDGCMANQTYNGKVQDDENEGIANNVQGTPTFFINNVRYVGAMSNAQWDTELKAAIGS